MPVKTKLGFEPFYLTFSSPDRFLIKSPAEAFAITRELEEGKVSVDGTSAEREKGGLADILGAILWNQIDGMAVFDVKLGRLVRENWKNVKIRMMFGTTYSPVTLEQWGAENGMMIKQMIVKG